MKIDLSENKTNMTKASDVSSDTANAAMVLVSPTIPSPINLTPRGSFIPKFDLNKKADVSAWFNNCGFNVITHHLVNALLKGDLDLVLNAPIYQNLLDGFRQRYALDATFTFEDLKNILKSADFQSKYSHEILLAPVLREMLFSILLNLGEGNEYRAGKIGTISTALTNYIKQNEKEDGDIDYILSNQVLFNRALEEYAIFLSSRDVEQTLTEIEKEKLDDGFVSNFISEHGNVMYEQYLRRLTTLEYAMFTTNAETVNLAKSLGFSTELFSSELYHHSQQKFQIAYSDENSDFTLSFSESQTMYATRGDSFVFESENGFIHLPINSTNRAERSFTVGDQEGLFKKLLETANSTFNNFKLIARSESDAPSLGELSIGKAIKSITNGMHWEFEAESLDEVILYRHESMQSSPCMKIISELAAMLSSGRSTLIKTPEVDFVREFNRIVSHLIKSFQLNIEEKTRFVEIYHLGQTLFDKLESHFERNVSSCSNTPFSTQTRSGAGCDDVFIEDIDGEFNFIGVIDPESPPFVCISSGSKINDLQLFGKSNVIAPGIKYTIKHNNSGKMNAFNLNKLIEELHAVHTKDANKNNEYFAEKMSDSEYNVMIIEGEKAVPLSITANSDGVLPIISIQSESDDFELISRQINLSSLLLNIKQVRVNIEGNCSLSQLKNCEEQTKAAFLKHKKEYSVKFGDLFDLTDFPEVQKVVCVSSADAKGFDFKQELNQPGNPSMMSPLIFSPSSLIFSGMNGQEIPKKELIKGKRSASDMNTDRNNKSKKISDSVIEKIEKIEEIKYMEKFGKPRDGKFFKPN